MFGRGSEGSAFPLWSHRVLPNMPNEGFFPASSLLIFKIPCRLTAISHEGFRIIVVYFVYPLPVKYARPDSCLSSLLNDSGEFWNAISIPYCGHSGEIGVVWTLTQSPSITVPGIHTCARGIQTPVFPYLQHIYMHTFLVLLDLLSSLPFLALPSAHFPRRILQTLRGSLISISMCRASAADQCPIEILMLICDMASPVTVRAKLHTSNPLPIILSHISRRWRHASICTASHWNTLRISSACSSIDRTTAYLDRSRDLPLLVIVDLQEIYAEIDYGLHFRTIILHAARWKILSLKAPSSIIRIFIPLLERLYFPLLEDMKIHTTDSVVHDTNMESSIPFTYPTAGYPKLSRLSVQYMLISLCYPTMTELVYLCLKSKALRLRWDLLGSMRRLRYLQLWPMTRPVCFTPANPSYRIELPSIDRLELMGHWQGGHLLRFLHAVYMPELWHLHLDFKDRDYRQIIRACQGAFIFRKPPLSSLTWLSLHTDIAGSWAPDSAFFLSLPNINRFDPPRHNAAAFLDSLHAPEGSATYWPKLSRMQLHLERDLTKREATLNALRRLVENRNKEDICSPMNWICVDQRVGDWQGLQWLEDNVHTVTIR